MPVEKGSELAKERMRKAREAKLMKAQQRKNEVVETKQTNIIMNDTSETSVAPKKRSKIVRKQQVIQQEDSEDDTGYLDKGDYIQLLQDQIVDLSKDIDYLLTRD